MARAKNGKGETSPEATGSNASNSGTPTAADYAAWTAETDSAANGTAATRGPATSAENSSSANREAATYRRRLRTVEAERDSLAEQVQSMQRVEAERIASERLARPDDMWTFGAALADLLDERGMIDPVRVDACVDALLGERPGLAVQRPAPFPYIGQGKRRAVADGGTTWKDVLTRR